jgi:hypothetical protein
VIRVSQRNADADVRRARAIVASGRAAVFYGPPRQLRRVAQRLADDEQLRAFLGADDDEVMLVVEPLDATTGCRVAD